MTYFTAILPVMLWVISALNITYLLVVVASLDRLVTDQMIICTFLTLTFWAMIMSQLAEWSIPTPDDIGLNPDISNFLITFVYF